MDRKLHDRCALFSFLPATTDAGRMRSWGWRGSRCQHSHLSTRRRQNQATGTARSPWPARLPGRPGFVRTRHHSRLHVSYPSLFFWSDIVKTTLRHDGIRGMYRGLGPTILGYLPTWAIYFAVYDGIKRRFGEPPLGEPLPRGRIYPAAQPKGYQPVMRDHPWTLHILSAMIAGATSTTCTNPLWVIKTRFMVCSVDPVSRAESLTSALTSDTVPTRSEV
jgi:hypothetical protein